MTHGREHARQSAPRLFPALVAACPRLAAGGRVLLTPQGKDSLWPCLDTVELPSAAFLARGPLAPLAVGTVLLRDGAPVLRLIDRRMLPALESGAHAAPCVLAEVLQDTPPGKYDFTPQREGFSLAWVTLSDKGALGLREDESGPLMESTTRRFLALGFSLGFLLPDAPLPVRALVADLTLHQGFDLVLTSGGTGLAPRDTTPESLLPLLDRRLHGFEQAMMAASMAKTPHALISRAFAGTVGQSIVIALPGSKKAVAENIEAVAPALAHALEKLQGDPSDCASL